jgi:hypothetical protein
LAAIAAVCLVLTLFFPWYQETVVAKSLKTGGATLTGWGSFSWVEAAVLLVSVGVLTLLFQRAEGRAFHVPGGDGGVIAGAGAWTAVLIIWRMFDKPGVSGHGIYATTSGVEWGIFIALAVAAWLAYCGNRIRAMHQPEPALPGEDETRVAAPRPAAERPRPARVRADRPRADTPLGRLFAERPAWSGAPVGPFEPPPRRRRPDTKPTEVKPPAQDQQLTIPLDDGAK